MGRKGRYRVEEREWRDISNKREKRKERVCFPKQKILK